MNPAREDARFEFGCLWVAITLFGLGLLAKFVDPKFWIAFCVLVGLWLMMCRVRSKQQTERDLKIFNDTFEPLGDSKPELEEVYLYGFPYFTLMFQSESDMDRAVKEGLIDRYRDKIQELYGHTGSKNNPFDAERAVYATYEGEEL